MKNKLNTAQAFSSLEIYQAKFDYYKGAESARWRWTQGLED